jgi:hypothetical protein
MLRTRVALCVLAVSAGSIGAVAPAQAAFPGRPGLIVFSSTFAGNRDIFTMSSDGSNRTDLTNDPHSDITPSWSADRTRIAFASDRSGAFEIDVMNADGSGINQVTHDQAQDDHPRFTPDGRSLVYESTRGGNREIRRIGVDGAGEVDLTRNRAADRTPAVSPNGRLVDFTRGGHVWVMTIDGKRQHRVTSGRGSQSDPSWAPRGGRLAYVVQAARQQYQHQERPGERHGTPCPCSTARVRSVEPRLVARWTVHRLPALLDRVPGRLHHPGAATRRRAGRPFLAARPVRVPVRQRRPAVVVRDRVRLRGNERRAGGQTAANGVAAYLASFAGPNNIGLHAARESQAWGEQYSSWAPDNFGAQPTSDTTGSLRVQRVGATGTNSYLRSGAWVPLSSGPTSTEPALIALGASSADAGFVHEEVRIAWDNLRINAGSVSCPLTWEDDSPDWQPLPS